MADSLPQRATIEVYEGNEIAFRGDAWVNATQLAKVFGRRPNDFMSLPATRAYLGALAEDLKALPENLVTTQTGGLTQGTWMHPDLALEFARWLSPQFGLWCNRKVRALLRGDAPDSSAPVLRTLAEGLTALAASQRQTVDGLAGLGARVENFGERLARLESGLIAAPAFQPYVHVQAIRGEIPADRIVPVIESEVGRWLRAALAGRMSADFTKRDLVAIACREGLLANRFGNDPANPQVRAYMLVQLSSLRKRGIVGLKVDGITYAVAPHGEGRKRRYRISRDWVHSDTLAQVKKGVVS